MAERKGEPMDLIERQKAIDALADMHCKSDEDGYVWIIRSDAWARIDALPSVTPKQKCGKWIDAICENRVTKKRRSAKACSECGSGYFSYYGEPDVEYIAPKFCPNCGARMTEETCN